MSTQVESIAPSPVEPIALTEAPPAMTFSDCRPCEVDEAQWGPLDLRRHLPVPTIQEDIGILETMLYKLEDTACVDRVEGHEPGTLSLEEYTDKTEDDFTQLSDLHLLWRYLFINYDTSSVSGISKSIRIMDRVGRDYTPTDPTLYSTAGIVVLTSKIVYKLAKSRSVLELPEATCVVVCPPDDRETVRYLNARLSSVIEAPKLHSLYITDEFLRLGYLRPAGVRFMTPSDPDKKEKIRHKRSPECTSQYPLLEDLYFHSKNNFLVDSKLVNVTIRVEVAREPMAKEPGWMLETPFRDSFQCLYPFTASERCDTLRLIPRYGSSLTIF